MSVTGYGEGSPGGGSYYTTENDKKRSKPSNYRTILGEYIQEIKSYEEEIRVYIEEVKRVSKSL